MLTLTLRKFRELNKTIFFPLSPGKDTENVFLIELNPVVYTLVFLPPSTPTHGPISREDRNTGCSHQPGDCILQVSSRQAEKDAFPCLTLNALKNWAVGKA